MELLVCLLVGALGAPVSTPGPRLPVVINTVDTTLSRDRVRAIADEARRIWAGDVQLDIVIPDGSVPAGPLIAIITDRNLDPADADSSSLGSILFVAPRVPMKRIVLSVAGARRLASQASWRGEPLYARPGVIRDDFVTHALGRALAHEIGHYLLRSPVHETVGLMRPQFATGELVEGELFPYALTGADRAAVANEFAEHTASVVKRAPVDAHRKKGQ